MKTSDFNLLEEEWIPVLCSDNRSRKIAPYEVTGEHTKSVPLKIADGQPDLDIGYMLFLVGLFQTALAPEDINEWKRIWDNPPSEQDLKEAFSEYRDMFCLLGDGTRYMQTELALDGSEEREIKYLRMDNHSEYEDLQFFHNLSTSEDGLPLGKTAALLTSYQGNAGAGGPGYYTSLRGSHPLNFFICGNNMWETIWLNVVPMDKLEAENSASDRGKKLFHWNNLQDETLNPRDTHPCFPYWTSPQKVYLISNKGRVTSFWKDNWENRPFVDKGDLDGGVYWTHPLSSYKDGSNEVKKGHMTYNAGDLTAPRLGLDDKNGLYRKPLNVSAMDSSDKYPMMNSWSPDLRISGFHFVNNAKINGFIDRHLPLFHPKNKEEEESVRMLFKEMKQFMEVSEKSIRRALGLIYNRSEGSEIPDVDLFARKELNFFKFLERMDREYIAQGGTPPEEDKLNFKRKIAQWAMEEFDLKCEVPMMDPYTDKNGNERVGVIVRSDLEKELKNEIRD